MGHSDKIMVTLNTSYLDKEQVLKHDAMGHIQRNIKYKVITLYNFY